MTAAASASTFRHGVHPRELKDSTEHRRIERMPFVSRYVLPLRQHLGAPSTPVVRPGEVVRRGQVIATPGAFVSTTLHSPVAGRVASIEMLRAPNGEMVNSIVIDADLFSTQQLPPGEPIDWQRLSIDEFVDHVQRAGIVGLGGAAFPSHVKYKLPEGKRCQHLLLNGCECEPYLTADHRLMVERPDAVVAGAEVLGTMLQAETVAIGVEVNKPDAIEALNRAIPPGSNISVAPLQVKYPQGAEKMLIKATFGVEVPAGKLPIDVGMVVNNVATAASLHDYFTSGSPLIERIVTVSGPAIERPSNLLVPVGTPVREVLHHCGLSERAMQVIMGGPMMGQSLASLDVPVLKGTSGLLAFTEAVADHADAPEYACVKCGRCLEACSNALNPSRLARLARADRLGELEQAHVMDCMECGACTYACPSGIPIVHLIRAAKATIRNRKAKAT